MVKTPFFTAEEAAARRRLQANFANTLAQASKSEELAQAKQKVAKVYKSLPSNKKWELVEAWAEGRNPWILDFAKQIESQHSSQVADGASAGSGSAGSASSVSSSSQTPLQLGDRVKIVRSRMEQFELVEKEEKKLVFSIDRIRDGLCDLTVVSGIHTGRLFAHRVPPDCLHMA